MHRIDSATARANVNGQGKNGFHDNGDLPNQDATYFTPEWANAVQEELSNVIEAFGVSLDKADNGQLLSVLVAQFGKKAVLESTINTMTDKFNQQSARIEALENRTFEDTQIGELFWTTKHFVTPSHVAKYKGYGTWERALQGRVPVGFSDIADDPIEFRTHGREYGEFTHTLTVDEMPSHTHEFDDYDDKRIDEIYEQGKSYYLETGRGGLQGVAKPKNTGGNQPHNNQPPSKTLDCWQRIA